VKDVNLTTADALGLAKSGAPFAAIGNVVYFPADDGVHGGELWRTDGTAAGTLLAAELNPGAAAGVGWGAGPAQQAVWAAGGRLYVVGTDAAGGAELWQYRPSVHNRPPVPIVGGPYLIQEGARTSTATASTPTRPGPSRR
jgi:ELWxxDGT repeat protein